jgi:hypothetical protein
LSPLNHTLLVGLGIGGKESDRPVVSPQHRHNTIPLDDLKVPPEGQKAR